MSPKDRQMYAADWFMCAAAILCALLLVVVLINEPPRSVSDFLLDAFVIVAVPVIITWGWGASLGATILDPSITQGAGQAALRGLGVSGASFLTYLFVLSFGIASLSNNSRGDFLKLFIIFLVYGTILVGWLVAIVGALTGVQLYKKIESERIPAGDKTQA